MHFSVNVNICKQNPNLKAIIGSDTLHVFQGLGDGNFSVQ